MRSDDVGKAGMAKGFAVKLSFTQISEWPALSCLCHGRSYHVILSVPEELAEEIRVKLFLINVLS